jgi:hypothetical protein
MWMFQGQHHYGGGGIRYPHGHKAGSQHKACNQPFVFGACTRQELHDFVSLVEPELLSIRISVRGRQTFDLFSRMSTRKSLDAQHQGFFYGQTCACTMFGAKNSQERFAFRLSLSCQATPYSSANPCVARLVIRSPLPRNPLKETS